MDYTIYQRRRVVVNTDPLRRCYNGCNFSEEEVWSHWEQTHDVTEERVEASLKYWRELNDYSVSVGGTRSEFKAEPSGGAG